MSQVSGQVRLGSALLERTHHACALFHTDDEADAVLLPFIHDALEQGERAFYVVDPASRRDRVERLRATGTAAADALERGQLEVRVWQEVQLLGGRFDQYAMLNRIEQIMNTAVPDGFSFTRLVAHMEWSLQSVPGVEDLIEFESRVNYLLPKHPGPYISAYDIARFDGGQIVDILRTHPVAIIGGIVQVNPFYVPPDEFLRELRQLGA